jgi:DNA-binding MarR family transcriptional regulator
MSSAARTRPERQPQDDGPAPELADRLGYLLKHAQLRLAELNAAALEPYGVSGRELAVLLVLDGAEPASQQEAARRLGIDRTTMVAFLDALEGRGLVTRRSDAADRRKNVVELTQPGRETLAAATKAAESAESEFLRPLSPAAARGLKDSLRAVLQPQPES